MYSKTLDSRKIARLRWQKLFWLAATVIASLAIMYVVFHLWEIQLGIIINDDGDSIGSMEKARQALTGKYFYDSFYAPFDASQFNSAGTFVPSGFIHRLIYLFFALFLKGPGAIANAFYFCSYPLIAASCYLFLLQVKVHPSISAAGGILFSFLPYHYYRNVMHDYLSNFFVVPLFCIALVWLANGDLLNTDEIEHSQIPVKAKFNRWKLWGYLSLCFLMGLGDIYYSVFAIIFLVFAGIYSWYNTHNWRALLAVALGGGFIALGIAVQNIPLLIAFITGSGVASGYENTRSYWDLEVYGLRLSHLLLPIKNHRINFLSNMKDTYLKNICYADTEGVYASLGTVMSVGFIVSVLSVLLMALSPRTKEWKIIRLFGQLNIAAFFIGTVGGVNAFIGLISFSIRCYNRISVFIAAFSIAVIALLLQLAWKKFKLSNWLRPGLMKRTIAGVLLLAFVVLGVLDQTPALPKGYYDEIQERQISIRDFSLELEKIVPANSMIFQLPVVSLYNSEYHDLPGYAMMWPNAYTKTIQWSFSPKYTDNASLDLQKYLIQLPTIDFLKELCALGFEGIYLDAKGYADKKLSVLRRELEEQLGSPVLVSTNSQWLYYSLSDFAKALNISKPDRKAIDEEIKKILQRDVLEIVGGNAFYGNEAIGPDFNAWTEYTAGEYDSELLLTNNTEKPLLVKFPMKLYTLSSTVYEATFKMGETSYAIPVSSNSYTHEVQFLLEPGINILKIRTGAPDDRSENAKLVDSRKLSLNIEINFDTIRFVEK